MSDEIRIRTEENELTLQEMSQALPDTSRIMARVGQCWWHVIYAARGGNWGLAGYYLRSFAKAENTLKVLRPKHRERLERFQAVALPPVTAALEAEDLEKFEVAFAAATDMANLLHAESGYPYIVWELPSEPPKGLQLKPVTNLGEDDSPNGNAG
jgi:hypothetical protein